MNGGFCRWKPDADIAMKHHLEWWRQEGMVLWTGAVPGEQAAIETGEIEAASTPFQFHADPEWIASSERKRLSCLDFPGDTLPIARSVLDCMSLVPYLGSGLRFDFDTVWYDPRKDPPEAYAPLLFDPGNQWWTVHKSVYEASMEISNGDYLVGYPGIGSNIEVLCALRGTEQFLLDLYDRPTWVRERLDEINDAFFEVCDQSAVVLRDSEGGVANYYFGLYGPGRTVLITLDPLAMISVEMLRDFVAEPLRIQCEMCDYTLLHVDGVEALKHIDAILEIDKLDAVQWTPGINQPKGGETVWHDLYKKILAAGKSVQAIDVSPEQLIPLLDSVGSAGMYICTDVSDRDQAAELIDRVEAYR